MKMKNHLIGSSNSFSSEDDSLDSQSANIVGLGDQSENSSIDSNQGLGMFSNAAFWLQSVSCTTDGLCLQKDDSFNTSTPTRKGSNGRVIPNTPLGLIEEASSNMDCDESSVGKSYPLTCDDSPSCSSDQQVQSPSLRTLLDVEGSTQSGRARPPRALFQTDLLETPKRKIEWKYPTESPSTMHAIHSRMLPVESPNSASRRTLFVLRRPATPPKKATKSPAKNKSPLNDASARSRNVYAIMAASPPHAMHRRKTVLPEAPK